MKRKQKSVQVREKNTAPAAFPWFKLAQLFILASFFLFLPPQNVYSLRAVTEKYSFHELLTAPLPAPMPISLNLLPPPELTAQGIMVVDTTSGVPLYEKNSTMRLFPASTTKIMTALVVLESYKLDDVVKVGVVVTEGQVMGLVSGETITVENLLYGMLIHSANDAAYALAEHYPGGVTAFVNRMNDTAKRFHLTDTHFANPIGYDDPNHYTTAKDLGRLSLVAGKNPTITKMVGVPQMTVADTTYVHFHPLRNVNQLVGRIPGVSGFKSGFTELAGQALVTTVQKNDHKVLIVLLKSADRFVETETLLNWVFANFMWREFTLG